MKKLKALIILICISIFPLAVNSAVPVMVKASLDSVNLLMGNITILHLKVTQDENKKGEFTLLNTPSPDGILRVCGDSVEIRTTIKRDTVKLGSGRMEINYQVPVQAFDSGTYTLPRFLYVCGRDSVFSNAVSLKVIPVQVNADSQISGYASIEEPDSSFWDFIPDWVLDLWWVWILVIVLIVLFVIGFKRYKKQGSIINKKPEPTPYQVAMQRLKNLKQRKLWEQGMEKEYFTLLTDILREYLEKRFGINALEMTSRQIMETLSENDEVKNKREYMRQILNMADFVKFAKIRPLPDDNISAYENALKFVEETRPIENDNEAEEGGKS